MIKQLHDALAPSAYEELPDFIRASMTEQEWMWLSDTEKHRLIANETEPENYDD